MARIKRGLMRHKRHKKIIEKATGYWGRKKNVFSRAHEQVMKAGQYAFRDRRAKKRDFRRLWITRINAAAHQNAMTYSVLMNGLKKAGIEVDRKLLADLAVRDPQAFTLLADQARNALAAA